jgi:hypothetical protein
MDGSQPQAFPEEAQIQPKVNEPREFFLKQKSSQLFACNHFDIKSFVPPWFPMHGENAPRGIISAKEMAFLLPHMLLPLPLQ